MVEFCCNIKEDIHNYLKGQLGIFFSRYTYEWNQIYFYKAMSLFSLIFCFEKCIDIFINYASYANIYWVYLNELIILNLF